MQNPEFKTLNSQMQRVFIFAQQNLHRAPKLVQSLTKLAILNRKFLQN